VKNKYHSIFISDVHFLSNGCQSKYLADFLDNNWCDNLFLIGDIIDGWRAKSSLFRAIGLKKNSYGIFCDTHQIRAMKKIMSKMSVSNVSYIIGNHDDFLEEHLIDHKFGNLKLCTTAEYTSINGQKFLLLHGHQFDNVVKYHKYISFIADYSYRFILALSKIILFVRRKLHINGYWSLSQVIKRKVKESIDIIYKFENSIMEYCRNAGYDGVICGHTHFPVIKSNNGTIYMNSGDWIDSCTALVENYDGTFELVYWRDLIEGSYTY